jgi:hypothetical protein
MITYLEAVQQILSRLRERTVSSVSETEYSKLLGHLLNDAREEVENSWNWASLQSTISVNTVASTDTYEIDGTQNLSTITSVTNDTQKSFLAQASTLRFKDWYLNTPVLEGVPTYYTFNGLASDGDTNVKLYPIPDGVYSLSFNVTQRGIELTSDADILLAPMRPTVLLAYAKAVEERGEDGGVGSGAAYGMANRSLADAIAMDSQKNPDYLIWESGYIPQDTRSGGNYR